MTTDQAPAVTAIFGEQGTVEGVARALPNDRRWVVEIPVAKADSLRRELADRYQQSPALRQGVGGTGVAHVSVARVVTSAKQLSPSLVDRLADVCASFKGFPFEFREVGVFAGGVVHLVPRPAEPFRDLARRCASIPPIGGATVEAALGEPHLTLAYLNNPGALAGLRLQIEAFLPLRSEATEARLVLLEPGHRTLVRHLRLR
jgi:2'-5' RNA ligase